MQAVRTTGVILLALLCLTAGIGQAAMDYAAGPGTIGYALTQPDGARASLTMVIIGRVDTAGVSVHEWWDKTTSLPALFSPPPGLLPGQTIDLEGVMTTLPRGGRAVLCDRIAYYLDRYGYLAPAVPPLKGLFDSSVWPTRGWVEVRPSVSLFSLSSPETTLLLDDPQPPGEGDPPPLAQMTLPDHSIAKAKSAGDDDPIPESLTGKIVTAGTNQFSGCFYVEEPDRSCGIRVVPTSGTYVPGDVVTISAGTMATSDDGERFIDEATVSVTGSGEVLPLGLPNRDIGGCDFADGQTMLQARVLNGRGLNNIGLLVKTWGKITYADPNGQFIYIDDGSALADGFVDGNSDPVLGVRVAALGLAAGNSVTLPAQVGAIVRVVGVSSCATVNQNRARMMRVRSQADVSPAVVYVKTTGNNNNDGLTWATAKASVQEALDTAYAGMEVWVAAGTYAGCITMKNGVGLYGGFSETGGETHREQRSLEGNPTVLNGNSGGSVVTCSGGALPDTILDGFTITGGTGTTDESGQLRRGGGIYCIASSPTIRYNTVTANSVQGSSGGHGAGICCIGGSALIHDNLIHSNEALAGAGVGLGGGMYLQASPSTRVVNNTIVNNTCENGSGGGIYSIDSSPFLANNIVALNTSGVSIAGGVPVLIRNCVYNWPGDDYESTEPGPTDIQEEPLFLYAQAGDYHLLDDPNTPNPCIDTGNTSVTLSGTDMDGEARIQKGAVDIGADEVSGWITLAASPAAQESGENVVVTALVRDPSTGLVVEDIDVAFSVQSGILGNALVRTDERGFAATTVSRATTGYATVTASIELSGGAESHSLCSVWFYPSQPINADAWPMFMHDPQHTGASVQADSAAAGITEVWTVTVPTSRNDRSYWTDHPNPSDSAIFPHPYIDSSPVHAPACPVVVGAWVSGEYTDAETAGYVVAFDPAVGGNSEVAGAPVWRFPRTGYIGAVASTPCIAEVNGGKRVYVGSMNGNLYCLNAQTGEFIWSYGTRSSTGGRSKILASPTVYEGRVYIGNESARFYCLDAATGREEWQYAFTADTSWPDRTGVSSAAIGIVDGAAGVYVGCDNGYLYCLSTADTPADPPGRVIWSHNAGSCIESSPTIYDDRVYFGISSALGGALLAVTASTGADFGFEADYLWHEVRATPAVKGGYLFVGEDTGNLFFRLDADTGDRVPYPSSTNPFDASMHAPEYPDPCGYANYFLGSPALTCAGDCIVGNDNYGLYDLSQADLSLDAMRPTGGIVCSSPAVSYAAMDQAKWIYALSRSGGGVLSGNQ